MKTQLRFFRGGAMRGIRQILSLCMAVSGFTLAGCASFGQGPDHVYARVNSLTLKPWKTAEKASAMHWPYAWASLSAYLHKEDGKELDITPECPEPHEFLGRTMKWDLWTELPRVGSMSTPKNDLERRLHEVHLRAEVWSNKEANTVIVAFGGTASLVDWWANSRWFSFSDEPDAYDVVSDHYLPAFVSAFKARANTEAWLKTARVVSAGHSLGGGIAQRFAYSLGRNYEIPTVKEVYAFNSSPVSGKRETDMINAKGMTIYRIYSRGEILAGVRSILQLMNPMNIRNEGQRWVDVRYAGNWSLKTLLPTGWVDAHGMQDLACFMKSQLPAGAVSPSGMTQ